MVFLHLHQRGNLAFLDFWCESLGFSGEERSTYGINQLSTVSSTRSGLQTLVHSKFVSWIHVSFAKAFLWLQGLHGVLWIIAPQIILSELTEGSYLPLSNKLADRGYAGTCCLHDMTYSYIGRPIPRHRLVRLCSCSVGISNSDLHWLLDNYAPGDHSRGLSRAV